MLSLSKLFYYKGVGKTEEYKKIEYKGIIVEVTRDGKVRWNGKNRNIYYNEDGYAVVSLETKDGWRSVGVHKLVALAYVPNPENKPEVNHKDYNRANPHADNLEWMTRKKNVNYSKCNRPDYSGNKNPNYGNHALSKKYRADKELSKEKQGRPGLQNGRCRPIQLYYDKKFVKKFDYIKDCCRYIQENYSQTASLDSIRGRIDASIRLNRPYKKMTFIKG